MLQKLDPIVGQPPDGQMRPGWTAAPADLRQGASQAIPHRTCHILVVDDDELVRETFAELLRLEGHQVSEAASGRAALDALRNDPSIGFLLSDLSMPEMDGMALIHAARQVRHDLPVALLTGYAAAIQPTSAVEVFRKPVNPEAIARHIERVMAQRG